jgi:hypothetical protein
MDNTISKVANIAFDNDISNVEALIKISGGNRKTAYGIVRKKIFNRGIKDLADIEIDSAMAQINAGFEIEWKS